MSFSGYYRSILIKIPESSFRLSFVLVTILTLNACMSRKVEDQFNAILKNHSEGSGVSIEYPKEGTIFPPELPAPLFSWKTETSSKWNVRLFSQDGTEICRVTRKMGEWRPDSATWGKIKAASGIKPVTIAIVGNRTGTGRSKIESGSVTFSFSKDSVGASVFYRAVPLPFGYAVKHVQEIEWYRGSIAGGKPQKVLDNIPVCANCHSFSGNGIIAMDIDYANDKGSYIITRLNDTVALSLDRIITWSDYRREDGAHTYGLLSQISPDGKNVLSTVKDKSVFVPVDNLEYSQLFFPVKGIIAVYDRDEKKFYELPGASDKKYVQSNPNWSPDGKEILFTRTNSYMSLKLEHSESALLDPEDVKEFTSRQKEFRFDLFRLPFNEGKGGTAVPVAGASENNRSNYFGRYSPDGKWIAFCQAENFMLLQADSKLYIMPASGGTARLMNCNTGNMNSWHSWSPNSRWLVFSSKQKGPYTQLYLTHIDENGNDSPPVFLENLAFEKRAANIPEFFSNKFPRLTKMTDNFSANALYYNRLAALSIKDKEYKDALASIEKTLSDDSTFYEAYKNKLSINLILGRSKSKDDLHDRTTAGRIIDRQLKNSPGNESLIVDRGELRLLMDDFEGALHDGMQVVRANPENYRGYELLSTTYQKTAKWNEAISTLKKMIELQPDNTQLKYTLATIYQNVGQEWQSMDLLNSLIAKYPGESSLYLSRAGLFLAKGDNSSAKADYDKAISADPQNYACYRERANFFRSNSSKDDAIKDYQKSLSLLEEDMKKNPQNAPLIVTHAEITELTGNTKAALDEYENYLRSWPLNYKVLERTGQIYYSLKQLQPAINAYSVIIDNFPGSSKIFFRRGLVWQQAGNVQNALNDFNNAIIIDPDQFPSYFFRARIRNQMGDKNGYESDLKTAANLLGRERSKRQLDRAEQEMLRSINSLLGK